MKQYEVEQQEIEELERRIRSQVPAQGKLLLDETKFSKFTDFPISSHTLKGLHRGKFTVCTEIQKQCLLHALAGRDILGASKTGSGKTLAFLIPMIEQLYRMRASREDVGNVFGLVLSPTRELSSQIYEMAKVLTSHHAFNIGLLVGGTVFKHTNNIQLAVGTPGRVLQHLEQSPQFDCSQLSILVFDEADQLLDQGFMQQIQNILSYLPPPREHGGTRQTMLFSATQTKKVKDLSTMSMPHPEYVSCFVKQQQEEQSTADKPLMTPKLLQQQYIVCAIEEKLQIVHEFLQKHCEQRTICFFTSCKQVKFVEACFRRMRIGLPVYALHGKQTAEKRRIIYDQFCDKQGGSVLFATDVASRGLDFPSVDWVLQADCPESAEVYIHRVGRTARNNQPGKALLILLPGEEAAFVKLLKEYSNVNLQKKQAAMFGKKKDEKKKDVLPLQSRLQDLLVKDPELKLLAQKAFKSYIRSVHLQINKQVFDVKNVPFALFAQSLGLGQTPRLKLNKLGGEQGRKQLRSVKNQSRLAMADEESGDDDDDDKSSGAEEAATGKKTDKLLKMMKRQPAARRTHEDEEDSEDEQLGNGEDFFTSKTSTSVQSDEVFVERKKPVKKPKVLRIAPSGLLKGAKPNVVSLDDEEERIQVDQGFVQRIAAKLKQEDEQVDRVENRKRVQEMHKERKKMQKMDEDKGSGGKVAMLASGSDDDASGEEENLEQQALRLIG